MTKRQEDDPLAYDTRKPIDQLAQEMAEDALFGRNEDAVDRELAAVRNAFRAKPISADDYELNDRAREILEGLDPAVTRSDVTIHAAEGVSEDLQESLLSVIREHPDLWFVEAKTKDGKSVLIHRGPHP